MKLRDKIVCVIIAILITMLSLLFLGVMVHGAECLGTKVYRQHNAVIMLGGCLSCQQWICVETGIEGEDCVNVCLPPHPETDNSAYDALKKKFHGGTNEEP